MTEFAQEVDTWHDFFALSGTAAVTLLGLLFIAVSLRPDIRTQDATSLQRTAIGHSFSNYLAVLLFSLYFLILNQGRNAFALEILLTSLVPLVHLCRSYLRLRHSTEMTRDQRLWFLECLRSVFLRESAWRLRSSSTTKPKSAGSLPSLRCCSRCPLAAHWT